MSRFSFQAALSVLSKAAGCRVHDAGDGNTTTPQGPVLRPRFGSSTSRIWRDGVSRSGSASCKTLYILCKPGCCSVTEAADGKEATLQGSIMRPRFAPAPQGCVGMGLGRSGVHRARPFLPRARIGTYHHVFYTSQRSRKQASAAQQSEKGENKRGCRGQQTEWRLRPHLSRRRP